MKKLLRKKKLQQLKLKLQLWGFFEQKKTCFVGFQHKKYMYTQPLRNGPFLHILW